MLGKSSRSARDTSLCVWDEPAARNDAQENLLMRSGTYSVLAGLTPGQQLRNFGGGQGDLRDGGEVMLKVLRFGNRNSRKLCVFDVEHA